MATRNISFNLTPIFAVWSVIFIVVAFATSDWSYLIWAAVPWALLIGFTVLFSLIVLLIILVLYLCGHPVTLETPRKGKRIVQRGRAPRPVR